MSACNARKNRAGLQIVQCNGEKVVVDNESTNKTGHIAKVFRAKILARDEHIIALVRKTDAKNASGDILIFVHAEVFQKIAEAVKDVKMFRRRGG